MEMLEKLDKMLDGNCELLEQAARSYSPSFDSLRPEEQAHMLVMAHGWLKACCETAGWSKA